jgi:hypothetical protein
MKIPTSLIIVLLFNKIVDKLQSQDKVIQLIQKPKPENSSDNSNKKTNNQQTKSKRYLPNLFQMSSKE